MACARLFIPVGVSADYWYCHWLLEFPLHTRVSARWDAAAGERFGILARYLAFSFEGESAIACSVFRASATWRVPKSCELNT